ncbi:MAG: hypothetical protein WCH62_03930, partial [Candidatus Omnitrophota bacterium]
CYYLSRSDDFKEFNKLVDKEEIQSFSFRSQEINEKGFNNSRFRFRVKTDIELVSFEGKRAQSVSPDYQLYPLIFRREDNKQEIRVTVQDPRQNCEYILEGLNFTNGMPLILKGDNINLSTIIEMVRRGLLADVRASPLLLDTFDYRVGNAPEEITQLIKGYRIDPNTKMLVEDGLVDPYTLEPAERLSHRNPLGRIRRFLNGNAYYKEQGQGFLEPTQEELFTFYWKPGTVRYNNTQQKDIEGAWGETIKCLEAYFKSQNLTRPAGSYINVLIFNDNCGDYYIAQNAEGSLQINEAFFDLPVLLRALLLHHELYPDEFNALDADLRFYRWMRLTLIEALDEQLAEVPEVMNDPYIYFLEAFSVIDQGTLRNRGIASFIISHHLSRALRLLKDPNSSREQIRLGVDILKNIKETLCSFFQNLVLGAEVISEEPILIRTAREALEAIEAMVTTGGFDHQRAGELLWPLDNPKDASEDLTSLILGLGIDEAQRIIVGREDVHLLNALASAGNVGEGHRNPLLFKATDRLQKHRIQLIEPRQREEMPVQRERTSSSFDRSEYYKNLLTEARGVRSTRFPNRYLSSDGLVLFTVEPQALTIESLVDCQQVSEKVRGLYILDTPTKIPQNPTPVRYLYVENLQEEPNYPGYSSEAQEPLIRAVSYDNSQDVPVLTIGVDDRLGIKPQELKALVSSGQQEQPITVRLKRDYIHLPLREPVFHEVAFLEYTPEPQAKVAQIREQLGPGIDKKRLGKIKIPSATVKILAGNLRIDPKHFANAWQTLSELEQKVIWRCFEKSPEQTPTLDVIGRELGGYSVSSLSRAKAKAIEKINRGLPEQARTVRNKVRSADKWTTDVVMGIMLERIRQRKVLTKTSLTEDKRGNLYVKLCMEYGSWAAALWAIDKQARKEGVFNGNQSDALISAETWPKEQPMPISMRNGSVSVALMPSREEKTKAISVDDQQVLLAVKLLTQELRLDQKAGLAEICIVAERTKRELTHCLGVNPWLAGVVKEFVDSRQGIRTPTMVERFTEVLERLQSQDVRRALTREEIAQEAQTDIANLWATEKRDSVFKRMVELAVRTNGFDLRIVDALVDLSEGEQEITGVTIAAKAGVYRQTIANRTKNNPMIVSALKASELKDHRKQVLYALKCIERERAQVYKKDQVCLVFTPWKIAEWAAVREEVLHRLIQEDGHILERVNQLGQKNVELGRVSAASTDEASLPAWRDKITEERLRIVDLKERARIEAYLDQFSGEDPFVVECPHFIDKEEWQRFITYEDGWHWLASELSLRDVSDLKRRFLLLNIGEALSLMFTFGLNAQKIQEREAFIAFKSAGCLEQEGVFNEVEIVKSTRHRALNRLRSANEEAEFSLRRVACVWPEFPTILTILIQNEGLTPLPDAWHWVAENWGLTDVNTFKKRFLFLSQVEALAVIFYYCLSGRKQMDHAQIGKELYRLGFKDYSGHPKGREAVGYHLSQARERIINQQEDEESLRRIRNSSGKLPEPLNGVVISLYKYFNDEVVKKGLIQEAVPIIEYSRGRNVSQTGMRFVTTWGHNRLIVVDGCPLDPLGREVLYLIKPNTKVAELREQSKEPQLEALVVVTVENDQRHGQVINLYRDEDWGEKTKSPLVTWEYVGSKGLIPVLKGNGANTERIAKIIDEQFHDLLVWLAECMDPQSPSVKEQGDYLKLINTRLEEFKESASYVLLGLARKITPKSEQHNEAMMNAALIYVLAENPLLVGAKIRRQINLIVLGHHDYQGPFRYLIRGLVRQYLKNRGSSVEKLTKQLHQQANKKDIAVTTGEDEPEEVSDNVDPPAETDPLAGESQDSKAAEEYFNEQDRNQRIQNIKDSARRLVLIRVRQFQKRAPANLLSILSAVAGSYIMDSSQKWEKEDDRNGRAVMMDILFAIDGRLQQMICKGEINTDGLDLDKIGLFKLAMIWDLDRLTLLGETIAEEDVTDEEEETAPLSMAVENSFLQRVCELYPQENLTEFIDGMQARDIKCDRGRVFVRFQPVFEKVLERYKTQLKIYRQNACTYLFDFELGQAEKIIYIFVPSGNAASHYHAQIKPRNEFDPKIFRDVFSTEHFRRTIIRKSWMGVEQKGDAKGVPLSSRASYNFN